MMVRFRVSSFEFRVMGLVVACFLLLVSCAAQGGAAANDLRLEVTVQEEARPAPTAAPVPTPEHWALGHGETAAVLCGIAPEGDMPAGEFAIEDNGADSIELICQPWSGGGNAAAAVGEADEHWALAVGGRGYALCGENAGKQEGVSAGEWTIRVLGIDVLELTCNPPFGE